MPSAKTCPACLLVSPGSADRCDCSFDFSKASPEAIEQRLAVSEGDAVRDVIAMLVVAACTIGFAVFQFLTAKPGDRILLPWPLLAFGLVAAARAFTKYQDARLARRENRPR